jgi:hypothetical protein
MWDPMQLLSPATSLIFAGRAGVARAQKMLRSRGLVKRVRTLRDYVENDAGDSTEQTDASTSIPTDWAETTIHVVGEKFGPGLAAVRTCPNPSAALVTRATLCRKYEIPIDSRCFSGGTVVELKGGMSIQMMDLRIGDMVETGDGKFARVYSFGHSDADA